MTVEELIEELKAMPPTARVELVIHRGKNGKLLDEPSGVSIATLVYEYGRVNVELDEEV